MLIAVVISFKLVNLGTICCGVHEKGRAIKTMLFVKAYSFRIVVLSTTYSTFPHILSKKDTRMVVSMSVISNMAPIIVIPKCNAIQLIPTRGNKLHRINARRVLWFAIKLAMGGLCW